MTTKDWMMATCQRLGATEADVDLVLVNQGLKADADVDVKVSKTALYKEFASLLPLSNVTEGGYSVSWNMEAVKLWYRQTASELGLPDMSAPRLRNRSNIW